MVTGILSADNSTLALTKANLTVTGLLQTNGGTTLTGADLLKLSGGTLEVAESLTLDEVTTDEATTLRLSADTTLVRDSPFTVGRVELDSHTLTLGSNTTDLTVDHPLPTEGNTSGGINVGAAALTFTGTLDLRVARLTSTTGTLTLASGGTLAENGLLKTSY